MTIENPPYGPISQPELQVALAYIVALKCLEDSMGFRSQLRVPG